MTRVVGSPWMAMVAYFIKRGRPVMFHAADVRNGEVAKPSRIACGSAGVEITCLDPVLALAAVVELHRMAHPNR